MSHRPKRHDRRPRYGGKSPRRKPQARIASEGVRLQKVLAAAGIGSRRQCEELIREGRVEVDGQAVTELGTRVNSAQKIRVDGETLRRPRQIYFAVNKPPGILATNRDPSGRPRVIDLAPSHERLFSVGRLDKSSEGLILVTNDGQLTDLLTHPRYGVEKTYLALVVGLPTPQDLAHLRRGVHFAEGFAHAKHVRVRRAHKQSAVLEIVLDEGRNREVRRLLARIGHKVIRLQRVAIGPLRLGALQPGESRPLLHTEVEELYHAAREGASKNPSGDRRKIKSSGPPPASQNRSSTILCRHRRKGRRLTPGRPPTPIWRRFKPTTWRPTSLKQSRMWSTRTRSSLRSTYVRSCPANRSDSSEARSSVETSRGKNAGQGGVADGTARAAT